jgi:hypothetical protein
MPARQMIAGGNRRQQFQRLPDTTEAPSPSAAFIGNARRHTEPGFDTGALAYGALFGPRDVPAIGFFRDGLLDISCTGGNGSGTAAIYVVNNQAPFNVIASFDFLDITGASLLQGLSSKDLYFINVFGGYNWWNDPRFYPYGTNLPPHAVNTDGTFRMQLYVPAECLANGGYSVPNESASAAAKMRIQLETLANVLTAVAPTAPTVDVRFDIDVWTRPKEGPPEPPGLGSTAYWTKQVYPTNTGLYTQKLSRVGNWIHTLIPQFINSTPAPYNINSGTITDIRLRVDGFDLIGPETFVKHWTDLTRDYGILFGINGQAGVAAAATPEVAGLTNPFLGLLPFTWRNDVGHPDRGESALMWLPTTGATRLELALTLPAGGSGGNMNMLTGDAIPVGERPTLAIS